MRIDGDPFLHVLQVASAYFPTGAFSHSLGFETLVVDGEIRDVPSFELVALDWLRYCLAPADGIAVALVHGAPRMGDYENAILAVDQRLSGLKPARECYEASVGTGAAILRIARSALPSPLLLDYDAMVHGGRASGHGAIAFALLCRDHRVPRDVTVLAYVQSALSNLAAVVARLVPLGQLEVQEALLRARRPLQEAAQRALAGSLYEMGSAYPFLDVASMRHEQLYTRLCMS